MEFDKIKVDNVEEIHDIDNLNMDLIYHLHQLSVSNYYTGKRLYTCSFFSILIKNYAVHIQWFNLCLDCVYMPNNVLHGELFHVLPQQVHLGHGVKTQ